jgi:hypothetical protein
MDAMAKADRENIKKKIIKIFNSNLLNKKPDVSGYNQNQEGRYGDWAEKMMGIKRNNKNKPDLFGFEQKNKTTSKTSYGDWSWSDAIFKKKSELYKCTREEFFQIFCKPNPEKNNRLSWSGEPFPKLGLPNNFGQWLEVDKSNNVIAYYSYSRDKRKDKEQKVPAQFRVDNLTLAIWSAEKLKKKLESKFNELGWFSLKQNKEGYYTDIVFGDPITFDVWIEWVKDKKVFLDSGMYQGNPRPYQNWRSSNTFMEHILSESE